MGCWKGRGGVGWGKWISSGLRECRQGSGHSCLPADRWGSCLLPPGSQPTFLNLGPALCGPFLFLPFDPSPWREGGSPSCPRGHW